MPPSDAPLPRGLGANRPQRARRGRVMSDTSTRTNGSAAASHAPQLMKQNEAPCSAEKNAFVADAAKPLKNRDLSECRIRAVVPLLRAARPPRQRRLTLIVRSELNAP